MPHDYVSYLSKFALFYTVQDTPVLLEFFSQKQFSLHQDLLPDGNSGLF